MGYVNSSIFHLLLCPTIIYIKVKRRFSILGLTPTHVINCLLSFYQQELAMQYIPIINKTKFILHFMPFALTLQLILYNKTE